MKLSWQDWDPAAWEKVFAYEGRFAFVPEMTDRRVFVQFEGVMTAATPAVNGHELARHLGGYLPFRHEHHRLAQAG
jgi:beta-galactosidase